MLKFDESLVKKIADKWFRTDGSPKTRAMISIMIADTMKQAALPFRTAAHLFEKAAIFYKPSHVVGAGKAYWELVDKLEKRIRVGQYVRCA